MTCAIASIVLTIVLWSNITNQQDFNRYPPYPQPQGQTFPSNNQFQQPNPFQSRPQQSQFPQQQTPFNPFASLLGGIFGQQNAQINGPPPIMMSNGQPGPMPPQTIECGMPRLCVSSPYECRGRGGQVLGPCFRFQGPNPVPFGACCHFEATCGQSITYNGTHFRSPNFPNPYSDPGTCQVSIKNSYRNICQIRLDFHVFNLKQPVGGNCDSDRFLISGQANNDIIPPLCGYNPGQHIYVEVDDENANNLMMMPATLSLLNINLVTSGNRNRWFDIKVSYIPCNSPYRAPRHCLQYHYELLGSIKSFNYDIFNQGFTYFNNMDYTICFRKPSGFCTLTYTVPREEEGHGNELFHETNHEEDGFGMKNRPDLRPHPGKTYFSITPGNRDSSQTAHAGPYKCPSDYLILNNIRMCGYHLNDNLYAASSDDVPILDNSTGPIFARFVSSIDAVGKGFWLNYQMNPCMINGK